MAKQSVLKSKEGAVAALVLLLMANMAAVKAGWIPFLYCWGRVIVWPIYEPAAEVANLFALALFAYYLVRMQLGKAVLFGLAVVLVMGLPTYAEILFRMGGSCG